MPKRNRKSNRKVFAYPDTFYARWRLQCAGVFALRDRGETPPEHLLQAVWQHQRLLRHQLSTLDGRTVKILHPGFLSREGGPDFRGAVVQFENEKPATGDIEVDLHANGWRAHHHDSNPAFQNVILHVVWDGENFAGESPPRLVVRDRLDSPVAELGLWLNSEAASDLPETFRGKCSAPLREFSPEQLFELLRQAAQIRFQSKATLISARARQVGWEQSLWEGLFRALGYKHNAWPMQCVAEHRDRWLPATRTSVKRVGHETQFVLQTRLLGISNLLPAELTRAQTAADGYLRRVWDCWWRERDEFCDCVLPRTLWRFNGQRPANHPQRRIALATHWLVDPEFISKIEGWCAADVPESKLAGSLFEILQAPADEFWSWHWTIRSPRLNKPQPLLGAARVTDLAVNVILPWLWSRASEGENKSVRDAIERRFHAWPAAEDNSVLRLARQRLLGTASRRAVQTAAQQQGIIQIVRDFCDHSDSACSACRFAELVRQFSADSD